MDTLNVGIVKPSVSSYIWEITDFSTKPTDVKDCFVSPVFSMGCLDNTLKWRLLLYPKGFGAKNEDYLSIRAEYIGNDQVMAQITFSILGIDNTRIYELATKKDRLFNPGSCSWGFVKFIKREFVFNEQHHVLEGGTLKILCEVSFHPDVSSIDDPSRVINKTDVDEEDQGPNHRLKEFDEFEKLLDSETFSDITFVVEEKKLHAHKAILISRSPVFEVMLQHYTKEKQDKSFEITGMKYEVMKELLRFLYVGKVEDIDQHATELLMAADKYSIAGLKALCEKVLYKNLNIDNALEYLNLAAICDAAALKSQVIEFMANNLKDIVDKPEFDLFGDLNSKVICEVVRAISKKSSKE